MSENGGLSRPGLRITVVQALDAANTDRFYDLYRAAFDPMREKAAARHALTSAEFAAEMNDVRIDKYVAWIDDDAIGLTTLATDLAAVPWIEPAFYLSRYPDEAARGALFYLGFTLVDPNAEAFRVFKDMMDTVCRRFAAAKAVCAFDYCEHNARRAVGRIVRALPESFGAQVDEVDNQQYFELDFGAPAGTVTPQNVDTQRYYIADFREVAAPLEHSQ
jgi:hypothetical protein